MSKASTTSPASKRKTGTQITPYDVAAYLNTTEDMAAYLDAWLTEAPDDAAGITHALSVLARAKGMTQVANDSGLSSESLSLALGPEGKLSLATALKVVKALGMRLHVEAAT